MSNILVKRAWRTQLPSTQKLLLLALAEQAGDSGDAMHACWPTIDRLAEVCGVTRMTISVALNALEARGLVTRQRRAQSSSIYRLHLEAEAA
ncbi:helix-turn-helix domain-containing protein [Paraburkholderia bannensis]|uniref:helix-turn-helix domain-containing protein n=1 Tax=Paraburkholderia bannensis TaxID=765414 RepID=UPI0004878124|nr:helix-turn-helix domain-containing protein [Paraburkholderia bannensis]